MSPADGFKKFETTGVRMAKTMLFIDGTWLYSNTPKLAESCGKTDYHLDFGKLPRVLAGEVSRQMGSETDVIRTYLFGSYASNYDLRDEEAVQRRLDFFSMLREEYHYEVEIFPINFRGRRLRRADRDPRDSFDPKEKCVDLSLATAMLYYAAIPNAYDIGIAVVGDQDFKPVLQHVRRLGKRVAIASIKGSCAPDFSDPRDEARLKDFDIVWLDDLLARLELKYEPHLLQCESPNHHGERNVWTTFHPRKGQKFYCDECRAEFSKLRHEAQQEFLSLPEAHHADQAHTHSPHRAGHMLRGEIKKKVGDRGFGFIHGEDGRDYFFHLTDLEALDFDQILEGLRVGFEVKREPSADKAGAAQRIRRLPATTEMQA
jgi:CspA family cold shock protein